MYDIENQDKSKEYKKFHKEIKKMGGLMLQGSVYAFYAINIERVNKLTGRLSILASPELHIRGIRLTEDAFEKMDIIAGELKVSEKLMEKSCYIIEV